MIGGYFNFHNFSTNELDILGFMIAYLVSLVVTFYGWQYNLNGEINPILINLGIFLFIVIDVIYESYNMAPNIILLKLIFTLLSCYCFHKILDKFFN